jgi:cytochrome c oxidase cbb3-type subunit III
MKIMKAYNNNIFKFIFLAMLMLPFSVSAQASTDNSLFYFYITVGLIFTVSLVVLLVAFYLLTVLNAIIKKEMEAKAVAEGKTVIQKQSWWSNIMASMTKAVPVEKEETVLLDHNYDGIRELDNHLPPWWKWLFYATIAWSAVYMLVYHVFDTLPLPEEEYNIELALAAEQQQARMAGMDVIIDENTVEVTDDATSLAKGKQIYNMNCAACHKEDGGGSIGPNLTDEYWLHGGGIKELFYVVKYGAGFGTGMISWQNQLSPEQMRDVSSYILTMQGTNPPNAKGPEGERWVPKEEDKTEDNQASL